MRSTRMTRNPLRLLLSPTRVQVRTEQLLNPPATDPQFIGHSRRAHTPDTHARQKMPNVVGPMAPRQLLIVFFIPLIYPIALRRAANVQRTLSERLAHRANV